MNEVRNILDIELEKLALGELSDDRMAAAERAVSSAETRAKLEALKDSNEAILSAYPPHLMAVQIEERVRTRDADTTARSKARLVIPGLVAAAAAAAVVFAFLPATAPPTSPETPEKIITKGPMTPSLFVFRKGEDKEEFLNRGERAATGDVIQLQYNAKGASYGVIFSVDGRGTVTLHHPSDSAGSTALKGKGTTTLDFSYELDDAPRFERFFFVTSDSPLDVEAVLKKAKALGPVERGKLPLEAGLSQCDFVLKKTSRRI